jgi:hypothetical protein
MKTNIQAFIAEFKWLLTTGSQTLQFSLRHLIVAPEFSLDVHENYALCAIECQMQYF